MAVLSKFGTIRKSPAGGLVLDGFVVDMQGAPNPANLGEITMQLVKEDLLKIFNDPAHQLPADE
jgi:hypothetical protein